MPAVASVPAATMMPHGGGVDTWCSDACDGDDAARRQRRHAEVAMLAAAAVPAAMMPHGDGVDPRCHDACDGDDAARRRRRHVVVASRNTWWVEWWV